MAITDKEASTDAIAVEARGYVRSRLRGRLLGEAATVGFIAALTKIAGVAGASYILFPELGALAHDILSRPNGTWARAPVMLVLTPFLTALVGTLLTRYTGYGPGTVLLCVACGVLIIQTLRSPIAPAISAGLLPLSLDIRSWWYPPSILLGTTLLAGISLLYRMVRTDAEHLPPSARDRQDDLVEEPAERYGWIVPYFAFVGAAVLLVHLTGWRFVLFPPLAVIGFEMFAHPQVCPWANRPLALLLTCLLSALSGWALVAWFGSGVLATAGATALGIAWLLLFNLRAPPALSVALLPFVMDRPDPFYPLAVAVGVMVLSLVFQLSRL